MHFVVQLLGSDGLRWPERADAEEECRISEGMYRWNWRELLQEPRFLGLVRKPVVQVLREELENQEGRRLLDSVWGSGEL